MDICNYIHISKYMYINTYEDQHRIKFCPIDKLTILEHRNAKCIWQTSDMVISSQSLLVVDI